MKTKLLLVWILTFLSVTILSQTTINDAAFETYLETHDALGNVVSVGDANSLGDGTDGNNLVPTNKINVVTELALSYLGIEDLTGIEDFIALENFTFQGNATGLTAVDLTSNVNLISIDVSNFPNLATFNVSGLSNVTSLNFLSSNVTSLDFSSLVSLTQLNLLNHSLLSNLNIKNGFNSNITDFSLNQNPVLSCVIADAATPAIGLPNWYNPLNVIFDEFCSQPLTYVPDNNFETFLEANSMGNGVANDDKVTTSNINTVTFLDVSSQSISDLTGIKDFDALVDLRASSNTITDIDVSENLNLEKLILNSNSLTDINVEKNIALKELWVRENSIKIIDVSKNTNLEWLICSRNDIENLDLSANTSASFLELHTNNLKTLNLKNIPNNNISYLDTQSNPSLTCIEVDDAAYFTANFGSQIDSQTSFNTNCNYPETNVPDSVFENYLETHDRNGNVVTIGDAASMGNGIASDNKVFTHKINTVTDLNVSNLNISSFTGIEDFRDLELFNLFGGNNVLVSIDLSQNVKLNRIALSLVSTLTNVTLGNLPDLTWLQLGFTNVSTIDISGLPSLDRFVSQGDKLTSLDTSGNPVLKTLGLVSNSISMLDISASTMLESLSIDSNQLTSLDVSNNVALTNLSLSNNQITDLDLSNNPLLVSFNASNNSLESLNLQSGGNSVLPGTFGPGFSNFPFDIRNNPNLICVQVDNVSYSDTNWTAKDSQTIFNTDCSAVWTINTSAATLSALLAITPSIDTDNSGDITLAEAAAYVGTLDLSNSGITDVEGLQAFTGITTLDVSGNSISDLSPLTGLVATVISRNASQSAATGVMSLEKLVASGNSFEAVDLSALPNLTEVDLSNNPDLVTITFQNGNNANITSFDATNSPKLTCILVDDANASYLSTWSKDATASFVQDENECLGVVLSTDSVELKDQISLYPNPVSDILNINISDNLELTKIEVVNVIGKRVMQTLERNIDMSGLSNGIYLIQIQTNKGLVSKKVIKD